MTIELTSLIREGVRAWWLRCPCSCVRGVAQVGQGRRVMLVAAWKGVGWCSVMREHRGFVGEEPLSPRFAWWRLIAVNLRGGGGFPSVAL